MELFIERPHLFLSVSKKKKKSLIRIRVAIVIESAGNPNFIVFICHFLFMATSVKAVLWLMFRETLLVPGGVPIFRMKLGFRGLMEHSESIET